MPVPDAPPPDGIIDTIGRSLPDRRRHGTCSLMPVVMAVPFEEAGDRLLLPRQLARQGVDLRLPLRGQRGELGAIALEERARIGRLAPAVVCPAWQQAGDQCGHAACDLPVHHVQLTLRLPTRFVHAGELSAELRRERHGDPLPCQPMKLEGPA